MSLFIIISSVILIVTYAYIGLRLLGGLALPSPWNALAWVILAIFPLFHIISFSLYAQRVQGDWFIAMQWANFILMGLYSLVLASVFFRDILWTVLAAADYILKTQGHAILPRDFAARVSLFNYTSLAVITLSLIGAAIGFIQARNAPKVTTVQVPIANLHPDLQGFRIAQITDVHIGPTIRREQVQRIVDITNSVNADLIAITGDLVDGTVPQLEAEIAPMAGLTAPQGVYFVTGNHEYYSGAEQWNAHYRKLGFDVLNNENRIIKKGGAKLLLGGVTDYNAEHILPSHHSDPAKAAQNGVSADARLLLAHQPRSMGKAAAAGFDLQISGHTHGGQFFPWNFLIPLQQPITSGLKKVQNGAGSIWVYVSHGAGYWGPPLRLLIPPEVSVIELTAG